MPIETSPTSGYHPSGGLAYTRAEVATPTGEARASEDGLGPPGRHSCSGNDLLTRLLDAGVVIGAARLLLRAETPPLGVIDHWDDYFKVEPDGSFEVRGEELVRVCLHRGMRSVKDVADRLEASEATVSAAPRMLIRGRDLVRLLHKILKSPWGKRVSSTNFAGVDEATLTAWLLGSTSPEELDPEPLFVSLRSRFASAAS